MKVLRKAFRRAGGEGANFRAAQAAGLRATVTGTIRAATQAPGFGVVRTVARLIVTRQAAGLVVELPTVTGSARVGQATGLASSSRASGSPAHPDAAGGARVTRITYNLTHRRGSNAVTEVAMNGRTDWANDGNAAGLNNATLATLTGLALNDAQGDLRLAYADMLNKASLTITLVELVAYWRMTGIPNTPTTARLRYSLNSGSTWTTLAERAAAFNVLSAGEKFNITAAVGGDWSKIDGLLVSSPSHIGLAQTGVEIAIDAVVLEVTASATDTL